MKNAVTLAFVLVLSLSTAVFAQDSSQTAQGNQSGMMGGGGMMGEMIGAKTMVASDNGSVVILSGNKLLKYDKDLKLVKEADVKIEQGAMMGRQGQPAGMGQQKPQTGGQTQDAHHPL